MRISHGLCCHKKNPSTKSHRKFGGQYCRAGTVQYHLRRLRRHTIRRSPLLHTSSELHLPVLHLGIYWSKSCNFLIYLHDCWSQARISSAFQLRPIQTWKFLFIWLMNPVKTQLCMSSFAKFTFWNWWSEVVSCTWLDNAVVDFSDVQPIYQKRLRLEWSVPVISVCGHVFPVDQISVCNFGSVYLLWNLKDRIAFTVFLFGRERSSYC